MGIPIKEGRDFDRRDMHDESKVAIVNEQFARHFFGYKSAVGRHLGRGGGPGTKVDTEIIGVSANSLYEGQREGVHRQVFIPNWGDHVVAFDVRDDIGSPAAYGTLRNALAT